MPDAFGNCVTCGAKVSTSDGRCRICDGDGAKLRQRLEQAERERDEARGFIRLWFGVTAGEWDRWEWDDGTPAGPDIRRALEKELRAILDPPE